jgi:hypothetical protein
MENVVKLEDNALAASIVETDYFLQRIRKFEQNYQMDSYEFLVQYEKNPENFQSSDFSHWAFLCRNFFEELFLLEVESDSPPGSNPSKILEKPDFESGFFIRKEITCSTIPKNIFRLSRTRLQVAALSPI